MRFRCKDGLGNRMPFCLTADKVPVFYSLSNDYHLLNRDSEAEFRRRIETLHWIKPMIEETIFRGVKKRDVEGINGKRRIYYHGKLMFAVVLNRDKAGFFELSTAYSITQSYMRKKMEEMFG